ncbi:TPA: hypothetical protein N0F65_011223, partial [Lagenidium giganteum]
MSGSFYASLKVLAEAFTSEQLKQQVSIFVDNGCSLNGISEALAAKLKLTIHEDQHNMMTVDLGFGQSVQQPRRTAFLIMPIPENNDVILGMIWLR